jgi:hypothetical protein
MLHLNIQCIHSVAKHSHEACQGIRLWRLMLPRIHEACQGITNCNGCCVIHNVDIRKSNFGHHILAVRVTLGSTTGSAIIVNCFGPGRVVFSGVYDIPRDHKLLCVPAHSNHRPIFEKSILLLCFGSSRFGRMAHKSLPIKAIEILVMRRCVAQSAP